MREESTTELEQFHDLLRLERVGLYLTMRQKKSNDVFVSHIPVGKPHSHEQ